mgnify:CR=1 FL=1|tara:strand:+ start:305 stop:634 length:330 start_codon:yes stop_codon:yes gene_type:complete
MINNRVLGLLKKRLTRKRLRRVLSHSDYVEKLDGNSRTMQQNHESPMYDTYCLLNFGYVYPICWKTGEDEIEISDWHNVEVAEVSITGTDSDIIDQAINERQFSGEIFE